MTSSAGSLDRRSIDTETGYIYLRARYYDPTTARFLTRDPLDATTRSAYGYGGNDPLNQDDPQGLCKHHGGAWGFVRDTACSGGEAVTHVATSAGREAKSAAHVGLDLAAFPFYANYYVLYNLSLHVNQVACSSAWGPFRTATCVAAHVGNAGSGVLQVANLGADELIDETKQACGLVPGTYSNDDEGKDILLLPRQWPGPNPTVHDAPGVRHGGGPWDWDIQW